MDSLHSAFSTEIVRQGYAARTKSRTQIQFGVWLFTMLCLNCFTYGSLMMMC